MAIAWIPSNSFTTTFSSSSSSTSSSSSYTHIPPKFHKPDSSFTNNTTLTPPSYSYYNYGCKCELSPAYNNPKFVLHDALDSSGLDTAHAREARDGFCSQINRFTDLERKTSISVNREVDLGRTALLIAAEDDSLISHSSVPLPVDDFLSRLDDLSMGYCRQYSSSFRSSPQKFIECLERFLYIDKHFRRTNARNQVEQRALYLHSVLTHRCGSASMLSLIYSEILKMLRMWGVLDFDVEIFFPHDPHSSPRGYEKQKSKESDHAHVMTSQSLLVQMLKDLKHAFWPFQIDNTRTPFLRAAEAASGFNGPANSKGSALDLASAKAARHRMERGVWTSVRFGDMRRALSACERLILLKVDLKELRDYAVLLYHCGFYEESLQCLKLFQENKIYSEFEQQSDPNWGLEEDAVEKLVVRLNLILMEEGWSRQSDNRNALFNNSDPW